LVHERKAVMDNDLTTITGVIALPVPVPPILEQAPENEDHRGAAVHLVSFF
jgi:hypothetical protein